MKISWGVLLLLITAGAFAAEDPALMAADRSIFQALFGDLYRAATGEIDFQDIQDSAMSNLFKVYNLWALGVLAWAAFILLNTGVFASGVNGKVFADRYSPWSTVRMGLVVLALMPVFNGWSGAQVMVATGVSVGNKLANEANEKMARFTFSEGRVDEPTPRKYAVRQVVEQIISSEMCMAMVNHKLDLIELQHIRQIKILEDKKENSWVLQDFIDKYRRKTEISTKNDVYANRVSMVRTEDEASAINLGIMTLDGTHDFSLSWGSEKAGDSACGKIDFQLDSGKFDDHDRQRLFAKQYWSAQIQAIEAVQREIRGKVESANAEIKPLTGLVFIETGYEQTVELTNPLVAPLLDGLNQGVGKKEFLSIDATVGGLNGVVSSSVETYMAALKAALEAQSEDAEIAYDHLRKIAEQAQQDFLEGNISAQELKELELPALVSNDVKGWMFAGFRWWDITREQLNANNLEKLYPGTESLDAGDFDGGLDKNVQSLDESFKRLIARRKASDQLAVDGEMSAEFLQKLSAENDENVLGFVAKYNNIFSTWLTSSLFKTLFDIEDKNFLDAVQDTGHSLTATSEILIGTILGLDIAHKAVSASGPVGAAVGFLTDGVKDEVKSTLWTVALILGVVGSILAYYLPMLPALHWMMALIGYLERVIATMIFSVLWVASMAVPDAGKDIFSPYGKKGWVNLLILAVYPIGMLASLYFVYSLFDVLSILLVGLMDQFIPSMNKGHRVGVWGVLAMLVILTMFFIALTHRVLSALAGFPKMIDANLDVGGGGDTGGSNTVIAGGSIVQSQSGNLARAAGGAGKAAGGGKGGENPNSGNMPGKGKSAASAMSKRAKDIGG